MIYRLLKKQLQKGNTDDMEKKLDVFYATDKITAEEYSELMDMLKSEVE